MTQEPIRAVIGVSYRIHPERATFYVERSEHMENYPGVWSLFSIQHTKGELPDPHDLRAVQRVMKRMSAQRLYAAPVAVLRHLIAGSSDQNPMSRMVHLNLYQIQFFEDPLLNPQYYTRGEWLTGEEFVKKTMFAPSPCGLCTKLWQEYQAELVG